MAVHAIKHSNDTIFADPRCRHRRPLFLPHDELPVVDSRGSDWDLRGRGMAIRQRRSGGQRVLEIGPASGFLTFEMEARRRRDLRRSHRRARMGLYSVSDARLKKCSPAPNRYATVKEFYWLLTPPCNPKPSTMAIKHKFVRGARRIRHRRWRQFAPLPRTTSDRRAMRKTSEITRHVEKFIRSWRAWRSVVWRRRRRIFSGTRGGISSRNSSRSFWQ